jgi:uncharacterized protein
VTGFSQHGLRALLACTVSLALAACFGTSRTARFYTLEPLQAREGPGSTATDATLAVGPVELPDYVDRPQIVTRTGANELVIAEFDRWGGSLDDQIRDSLVVTLRDRLAPRQVAVVPWGSAILSSGTPYRVAVSVSRFDGIPGQSVVLQARWELIAQRDGKEESLGVKNASVTEQIDGPDYGALVAAMQRALIRFGQQMGDSVAATKQLARVPLNALEVLEADRPGWPPKRQAPPPPRPGHLPAPAHLRVRTVRDSRPELNCRRRLSEGPPPWIQGFVKFVRASWRSPVQSRRECPLAGSGDL